MAVHSSTDLGSCTETTVSLLVPMDPWLSPAPGRWVESPHFDQGGGPSAKEADSHRYLLLRAMSVVYHWTSAYVTLRDVSEETIERYHGTGPSPRPVLSQSRSVLLWLFPSSPEVTGVEREPGVEP